jgi:hypothetical protein
MATTAAVSMNADVGEISRYDIRREIQKRADRRAKGFPLKENFISQQLFLSLVRTLTEDLIEGEVVRELNRHLEEASNEGKAPSLTYINTSVNKIFKKVQNWSVRNPYAEDLEKSEFSIQIKKISRSFCRKFDRQASCWR